MSQLTENAIKVLNKRYLKKDADGNVIEAPSDLFRRVAKHIAKAEYNYLNTKEDDTLSGGIGISEPSKDIIINNNFVKLREDSFYEMMANLDFLPNTPTLMNAGRPLGNLNACYVSPLSNDVRQILKTVKTTALIHKCGGGTGFNFSKIKLQPFFQEEYKPIFVLDSYHEDVKLLKTEEFTNSNILTLDKEELNTLIWSKPLCRVVYVKDDMDNIFDLEILLEKPDIIVFSNIRPCKSIVSTTGGEASGPASFMKVWDASIRYLSNPITPISTIKLLNITTDVISQGGVRRGANMGIVNIDCEYIYDFITCKKDNSEITNFNLSVGFVEGFWEAFLNNKYNRGTIIWRLKDYSTNEYVKMVNPIDLFDKIKSNAWKNGEPGIIFLDVINTTHPLEDEVEATNPCGKVFAT